MNEDAYRLMTNRISLLHRELIGTLEDITNCWNACREVANTVPVELTDDDISREDISGYVARVKLILNKA